MITFMQNHKTKLMTPTISEMKSILLENAVIQDNDYDNENEDFETESLYDLFLMMKNVNIDGKNTRLFFDITNDSNCLSDINFKEDLSKLKSTIQNLSTEQKALFEIFMNTMIVKYPGYQNDFNLIRSLF
jgi:hypothetical protein